jgi:predicted RNase H-like HicB family nuclease
MRFDLYLESGPQHKKTWVYVPDLPGCSFVGPTTERAIEIAPSVIGERLDFLRRHGEPPADSEPIEVAVAEHVIERGMLGFGQQFWAPDLVPLTAADVAARLRWAAWSREEFVAAAREQRLPLHVKPAAGGRSAAEILSHVAGAEWSYVSSTLGTLPGASAAIAAIEGAGNHPWDALASERATVAGRIAEMTEKERTGVFEREGRSPRTARRMLRRLLEHEWEHVRELRDRLASDH